jgi:hypothetical protein
MDDAAKVPTGGASFPSGLVPWLGRLKRGSAAGFPWSEGCKRSPEELGVCV